MIRSQNPFVIAGTVLFVLICTLVLTSHQSAVSASKALTWPSATSNQDGIHRGPAPPSLGITPQVALTESTTDNMVDVQNATLGFQKIYILSMPNRSDKRDALSLSAYLTGLEIEFIDGVNGSLVDEKAYPGGWKPNEYTGTIGCWRGHMEIYQKMVRERVQSALIMEDDVDWDVMIKAQMTEFARGTRHLLQASAPSHSPYGDGWNILSTGHCGVWNTPKDDQSYWVSDQDPTVVLPDQRKWWRKPDLSAPSISGERSRTVFSPYKLTCLASYAISLPGAARILYDQSVQPHGKEIDVALSDLCRRRPYGYYGCLAAYPMLTGVHRPAGDASKESDRKKLAKGTIRKTAQSDNLVYPVRLNLEALLKGETVVKAQFPEFAMFKEVDAATLQLPKGGPVFVKAEEYVQKPAEKPAKDDSARQTTS